jgi:hypothetical protein
LSHDGILTTYFCLYLVILRTRVHTVVVLLLRCRRCRRRSMGPCRDRIRTKCLHRTFPEISVELVSTASALALVSPGHSPSSILSRVRGVFGPSFAALKTPIFTFSMVVAHDCPSLYCRGMASRHSYMYYESREPALIACGPVTLQLYSPLYPELPEFLRHL